MRLDSGQLAHGEVTGLKQREVFGVVGSRVARRPPSLRLSQLLLAVTQGLLAAGLHAHEALLAALDGDADCRSKSKDAVHSDAQLDDSSLLTAVVQGQLL